MMTRTFFNRSPLTGNQLAQLPAGAIRATGAFREQLIALRAGLLSGVAALVPEAGPESAFYGGTIPADPAAAHVLEAMLRTAAVLADKELERDALSLAQRVVEHQGEDGAFGGESATFGARSAMLRAIQVAYSITGEKQYLSFFLRYFKYLQGKLRETELEGEDVLHIADTLDTGILLYNITGQKALLPILDALISQGTDYASLFHTFPYRLPISDQILRETWNRSEGQDDYLVQLTQLGRGVNLAEGLRAAALTGMVTGNAKHISAAERGIARMNRDHGAVSGGITADPLLAGASPTRGVSIPAAAEMEASFETLFTCPDGGQFADQWERIFYNVIQSGFDRDMHAVQSIQQANQLSILTGERFPFSSADAALYTVREKDALCAILPVIPRFLMHQWMLSRDDGLCAMGYAPCRVRYRLKDAQIRISVESSYPRSGNVRITLNMDHDIAFPLRLRIPAWAHNPSAIIQGESVDAKPGMFLVLSRQWHDGDVVVLNLPMRPKIETGYHQAVSVTLGPVLYALPLSEKPKPLENGEKTYTTTERFNHAIVTDEPIEVFADRDGTQVRLKVSAVSAGLWLTTDDNCDPPPMTVPKANRRNMHSLILVPYADTLLRISVFPQYSFMR